MKEAFAGGPINPGSRKRTHEGAFEGPLWELDESEQWQTSGSDKNTAGKGKYDDAVQHELTSMLAALQAAADNWRANNGSFSVPPHYAKRSAEEKAAARVAVSAEEEAALLAQLDHLRATHRYSPADYTGHNAALLLFGPRRLMARGALATLEVRGAGRALLGLDRHGNFVGNRKRQLYVLTD